MAEYYDDNISGEIDILIGQKKYNKALNLAQEYYDKYPDDKIRFIFLARALIHVGKVSEGLELAEQINSTRFHNKKSEVIAKTWYGTMLLELNRDDEALEVFKTVPSGGRNERIGVRSIISVVDALLSKDEYDEALNYLNNATQYMNSLTVNLAVMKATLLHLLKNSKEALEVLDSLPVQEAGEIRNKNIAYARIYYDLEDYDKAISYYKKAFGKKDSTFYTACLGLGQCYIKKYEYKAAMHYSDYLLKSKDYRDAGKRLAFDVYFDLWLPSKIREMISTTDSQDMQLYNAMLYQFAIGDFPTVIKYCEQLLNTSSKNIDSVINHYIYAHARLGMYEKALYIAQMVNEKNDSIIQKLKILCANDPSRIPTDSLGYSSKQFQMYSKKRALNHVLEGHLEDLTTLGYGSKKDIKELMDEILEKLPTADHIAADLYNKAFIRIEKDGISTLFHVIYVPDTDHIITFYPIMQNIEDSKKVENISKITEKRRLSQLEKWNRKYGTNK